MHEIIQVDEAAVYNCSYRLIVSVCLIEYLPNLTDTCMPLSLIV